MAQEQVQMKAAQGVICDVTPCLCRTPVEGKEEKTALSNPVKRGSVKRSPSLQNVPSKRMIDVSAFAESQT